MLVDVGLPTFSTVMHKMLLCRCVSFCSNDIANMFCTLSSIVLVFSCCLHDLFVVLGLGGPILSVCSLSILFLFFCLGYGPELTEINELID